MRQRGEELIVDRDDGWTDRNDLPFPFRRQSKQHAASITWIDCLDDEAKALKLSGLCCDEGAGDMQDLSDLSDADAVSALKLRDGHQHTVLRAANSNLPCEMGADGLHPHRNCQQIIDQLAKSVIGAGFKQCR